ncbi:DUF6113 family protein [Kitasatospora terrestris]|uniref:DUF6113 family protein n=1 Tax=Kitasatospora terrestris TaxID=258051 RepID=UPI0031F0EC5E
MKVVSRVLGTREQRLKEPLPPRGVRIALYAALFLLGGLVSLFGAFVQTVWPPVGLLLTLVATAALFYAGLRATGTKLGAGVPLAGWFVVLMVLLAPRQEGDLVLEASVTSYLYLFLGAVAGVVCATLPTRSGFGFGVPPAEPRQAVRNGRP